MRPSRLLGERRANATMFSRRSSEAEPDVGKKSPEGRFFPTHIYTLQNSNYLCVFLIFKYINIYIQLLIHTKNQANKVIKKAYKLQTFDPRNDWA